MQVCNQLYHVKDVTIRVSNSLSYETFFDVIGDVIRVSVEYQSNIVLTTMQDNINNGK